MLDTASALAPDSLSGVLDDLISLVVSDPVDLDGFLARVATRGWVPDGRTALLVTDIPCGSHRLSIDEVNGVVAEAGFNLMRLQPATPDRDDWLTDMFAAYVSALIQDWGAPVGRERGKMPQCLWQRPAAVVTIGHVLRTISATVYTVDGYARLREQGSVR